MMNTQNLILQDIAVQDGMVIADVALKLRPGSPADAQACAEICYEAFKTISEHHRFPPDFPSTEVAKDMMSWLLSRSDIFSVVAEVAGKIVGSNFLWQESIIAGVGPITVTPTLQNIAVGKRLMVAVLEQQQVAGVRLVQAAFHNRSLSLYTRLGFDVQEPLVNLQGSALGLVFPAYPVRPATLDDLAACNRLCRSVHGFDRSRELSLAIEQGTAMVVEHDDRLSGYATLLGFFGHAVGETNEDMKALIGAAKSFEGPGFLLPTRNSQLFRWCLQQGLRVVQPMSLMSLGLYHQPQGAFLPSILF
jgi:predicted N-acetyltransferase YhbS